MPALPARSRLNAAALPGLLPLSPVYFSGSFGSFGSFCFSGSFALPYSGRWGTIGTGSAVTER